MKLIDLPHPADRQLYGATVEKLVSALSEEPFVDAIYQVGDVRHPGISDIDLLVVVRDEAESREDPLARLSVVERYLFTHSCFVVPSSLAADLGRYVLLTGYRHLHGGDWEWAGHAARSLEVQTALEFLAKNLVDLYVQLSYGMLKVRVFLQHLKGVRLDLTLIGLDRGPLGRFLDDTALLVDDWFARPDSERHVVQVACDLLPLLREALGDATTRETLYAPSGDPMRFAPNVSLEDGPRVRLEHRGIRLPRVPALQPRQQFNAHHRTNRFRFVLPMTAAQPGSYYAERFEFLARAKAFAAQRFASYAAPIPPLFYRAL